MKFIKKFSVNIPKYRKKSLPWRGLIKNDKMRVLVAKVYGMYLFCLLHTNNLPTTFYIPEKHAYLLKPSDHPMTLKNGEKSYVEYFA
jgi:hypothetical protein